MKLRKDLVYCSRVMKMYRYTEEDRAIIAAARKANKDKRAEKRLHALDLRASGKSAKEIADEVSKKYTFLSLQQNM